MQAWLVVNAFTTSSKFLELYQRLRDAAIAEGVDLVRKDTIEVAAWVASADHAEPPSFALFWDKDVRLCRALELAGVRCHNSARAIELCDDKAQTYLALLQARIAQPRCMLVPKAFHPQDWGATDFCRLAVRTLGLPLVAKECYGSFGAQVHLVRSEAELALVLGSFDVRPSLCQEFIKTSKGHDVRLQVVGGRVVASMERFSQTEDFRANLTNGGMAREYSPTIVQERIALAACEALGLDFAGVDLLFGAKGEPLVCEVNSNAHFVNLQDVTGVDVARHILRHCMDQLSK